MVSKPSDECLSGIIMKKYFLISFLILAFVQVSFADKFAFIPIVFNLRGIELRNDTIFTYGSQGSMLFSPDNGVTWSQIKVFENGVIRKLFFEQNRLIAFNDSGKVSLSTNKGKSWELTADWKDSIIAVIKYPEGYLLRTQSRLFTISEDFKFKNDFPLVSETLGSYYIHEYNYSLTCFKGKLIAESGSGKYYLLDYKLRLIDTVSLMKLGLCTSCISNYQILSDTTYCYCKVDSIIFRTKDFKVFEKYYKCSKNWYFQYQLINNNLYVMDYTPFPVSYLPYKCSLYRVIDKDTSEIIANLENNDITGNIYLKNFAIKGNKLITVGWKKTIAFANFGDTVLNLVSDFTGGSRFYPPDRMGESSFLFYCGYNQGFLSYPMFKTENSTLTFRATVDPLKNPTFEKYQFLFKFYDSTTKTLYLGGNIPNSSEGVFISKDFGKNFESRLIPGFQFYSNWGAPYKPYLSRFPNIYKNNNYIVTANWFKNYNIQRTYSYIYTFNEKFEVISKYMDSNMVVDFINSKDTNTFLVHCLNLNDTTTEFKYTENKGLKWDIIKKYSIKDSNLHYKEFVYQNKPMLALFYFRNADSICSVDVLDIEAKMVSKIYEYKINKIYYESKNHFAICNDDSLVYLAIEDTLFYINDLYNPSQWKYYRFPNNGRIFLNFQKYGDKFFARYADDQRENNIYWFTIENTIEPKPKILASDWDFGKIDIKSGGNKTHSIKIENFSKDANLIITGYSQLKDSSFTTNLPKIDSLNTLTIKPGEFYECDATFKPKAKKVYIDSIVYRSNAPDSDNISYLSGEGIDTTTSVIEVQPEFRNYLYSLPPYPIPASHYVRTLIYWDTSLDIDSDDIGVFDIYGTKVSGKEKIIIDKQANFKGLLSWDCTGITPGVYFIRIIHGTASRNVKVLVDR
ncbi:MAG: hypothetical protein HW421_3126 [Ignavibacteria bacterium]|nr:hypothetical protein [Ignavibacteria bacterium]